MDPECSPILFRVSSPLSSQRHGQRSHPWLAFDNINIYCCMIQAILSHGKCPEAHLHKMPNLKLYKFHNNFAISYLYSIVLFCLAGIKITPNTSIRSVMTVFPRPEVEANFSGGVLVSDLGEWKCGDVCCFRVSICCVTRRIRRYKVKGLRLGHENLKRGD